MTRRGSGVRIPYRPPHDQRINGHLGPRPPRQTGPVSRSGSRRRRSGEHVAVGERRPAHRPGLRPSDVAADRNQEPASLPRKVSSTGSRFLDDPDRMTTTIVHKAVGARALRLVWTIRFARRPEASDTQECTTRQGPAVRTPDRPRPRGHRVRLVPVRTRSSGGSRRPGPALRGATSPEPWGWDGCSLDGGRGRPSRSCAREIGSGTSVRWEQIRRDLPIG
jgi:hypothetical protein